MVWGVAAPSLFPSGSGAGETRQLTVTAEAQAAASSRNLGQDLDYFREGGAVMRRTVCRLCW